MFTLIPFIDLFWCYGTKMENEATNLIPSWFFYFEAVAYFTYRMLDEMDGKQARRTGNSSALGMIFDHGCDAFSIGFQLLLSAKFM